MSEREEWGEWQSPYTDPIVGRFIEVEAFDAGEDNRVQVHRGIVTVSEDDGFNLSPEPEGDWVCIRWRERKPRALQQLREMIETLPAPRQKEDA